MDLNNKYRPQTLQEICGQEKPIRILKNMIQQQNIRSCIFYGPPGSGKTTAAMILASQANMPFIQANATNTGLTEIRKLIKQTDTPALLYLDEIQYFNKKQQQSLLSYIESQEIILISATTDNPYYCCYDALLSRCMILEFSQVTPEEITPRLKTIALNENRTITDDALTLIAHNASGDVRRAINQLELAFIQYPENTITKTDIQAITPDIQLNGFDADGEIHYSLLSALQKSIRGSDPDAAVFYLMRLLQGGDILSPCRRLLVIANEDIGLAQPDAIPFTYACCEMAKQLGLPEANKPLVNAVLYLALSPKSSSCERTYIPMLDDIKYNKGSIIPAHIHDTCPKDYKYPHDYPNHWVEQQYLPDDIKHKKYYIPDDNQFEQQADAYWQAIKNPTWTCPNCQKLNKNQFCTNCGYKKQ